MQTPTLNRIHKSIRAQAVLLLAVLPGLSGAAYAQFGTYSNTASYNVTTAASAPCAAKRRSSPSIRHESLALLPIRLDKPKATLIFGTCAGRLESDEATTSNCLLP